MGVSDRKDRLESETESGRDKYKKKGKTGNRQRDRQT
jgi:hypothetical protein